MVSVQEACEPRGESCEAHALFLGERIDMRATARRVASNPLVVEVPEGGCAALFRYGVIVFFDVPAAARASFVEAIRPCVSAPYAEPERESVTLRVAPVGHEGVGEPGEIRISDPSVPRLQVAADVLAKSVVLSQYEAEVAEVFNAIEPLAAELSAGRRAGRSVPGLLRHIGRTLLIQQKMVGRVEIPEKPELVWEHPELERLHLRLAEEYELAPRHIALERKLALINATATTTLEVVQTRRSLRVEWYIVVLIVVEIALNLYELFGRG